MDIKGVGNAHSVGGVEFEGGPGANQAPSRLVQMDPMTSNNGHDIAAGTVSSVEYDEQSGARTFKAAFRFEVETGASRVTFKKMDGTLLGQFDENGVGDIGDGNSVEVDGGGRIKEVPGGVEYISKEESGRFVRTRFMFQTGSFIPDDVNGLKVEAKEIKRAANAEECGSLEALPTHMCDPTFDAKALFADTANDGSFGSLREGKKSSLVFGQQEFVNLASVDQEFQYGAQQVSDYDQYKADSAEIAKHQNEEWSSESWGWFGTDYKGNLALSQFSAEAPTDWIGSASTPTDGR